jgi:hypothetical protein
MSTMPILIYAFHTTDEGGGFDWCPDTPDNREVLRQHLVYDLTHRNYQTGTLVTLTLKQVPEDWSPITPFLEGEWQDAVEVGAVGHIIARFSQEF